MSEGLTLACYGKLLDVTESSKNAILRLSGNRNNTELVDGDYVEEPFDGQRNVSAAINDPCRMHACSVAWNKILTKLIDNCEEGKEIIQKLLVLFAPSPIIEQSNLVAINEAAILRNTVKNTFEARMDGVYV